METLKLSNDHMSIDVSPLGARLQSVSFEGSPNLVHSAASIDDALTSAIYNGAVVGPVANRIADGQASLEGKTYTFEKNENGKTTLHSGSSGVHNKTWEVRETAADEITLTLSLGDGEGGFPGNRRLQVQFMLHGNVLGVSMVATSDAPTWMNLALHPYWQLSQGGAPQMLRVDADNYLPVDQEKIPTGEIATVDDTIFDLRAPGEPNDQIDHNFCLNDTPRPNWNVSLQGNLGLRMDIATDAPGVQIYSGKPIGIAIEPQRWPDAMHHPRFPSIEIGPSQHFIQGSTYRFTRL